MGIFVQLLVFKMGVVLKYLSNFCKKRGGEFFPKNGMFFYLWEFILMSKWTKSKNATDLVLDLNVYLKNTDYAMNRYFEYVVNSILYIYVEANV